jgi:hypothetical protein
MNRTMGRYELNNAFMLQLSVGGQSTLITAPDPLAEA